MIHRKQSVFWLLATALLLPGSAWAEDAACILRLDLEKPVPLGWSTGGAYASVVPPGEVYPEDTATPGEVYLARPGQIPTLLVSLFEGEGRWKQWEAFQKHPHRSWRKRQPRLVEALTRVGIDCARLGTATEAGPYWLWPYASSVIVSREATGGRHLPLAKIDFPEDYLLGEMEYDIWRQRRLSFARLSPEGDFVALGIGGYQVVVVPTSPARGLSTFCRRSSLTGIRPGLGLSVNTRLRAGPSTDAAVIRSLEREAGHRGSALSLDGALSCAPEAIAIEGAAARGHWLSLPSAGWIYGPTLIQEEQPEIVAATTDLEMRQLVFATRGGRVGLLPISAAAREARLEASRPPAPRMLGVLPTFARNRAPVRLELSERGDRLLAASGGWSRRVWDLEEGTVLHQALPWSSDDTVTRLSPSGEWVLVMVRDTGSYGRTRARVTVVPVSGGSTMEPAPVFALDLGLPWAATSSTTLPLLAAFLKLPAEEGGAEGVVFVDGEGRLRLWDARRPTEEAKLLDGERGDARGVLVDGSNTLLLLRGDPEAKAWSFDRRGAKLESTEERMPYQGKLHRVVSTEPGTVAIQAIEDGKVTHLELAGATSIDRSRLVHALSHGEGAVFDGRGRVVHPWLRRRIAVVDTAGGRTLAVVSLDAEVSGSVPDRCVDGVQSGDESGVDCGGAACLSCSPEDRLPSEGQCQSTEDCAAGTLCIEQRCRGLRRTSSQFCRSRGECTAASDGQGGLSVLAGSGLSLTASPPFTIRQTKTGPRSQVATGSRSTTLEKARSFSHSTAVGPEGTIFAAYLRGEGKPSVRTLPKKARVRFAQKNGEAWTFEDLGKVEYDPSRGKVDLLVDRHGQPHLFVTVMHQGLRLFGWGGKISVESYWMRREGRRWKKEQITEKEGRKQGVISGIAAAFDGEDRPHLVYAQKVRGDGQPRIQLIHASWDGAVWKRSTLSWGETMAWHFSTTGGSAADLALDENDRPHVVYFDGETGFLTYARREGEAWLREKIDVAVPPSFRAVALELEDADRPRVLFADDSDERIVLAERIDGRWVLQPLFLPEGVERPKKKHWRRDFHELGWAEGRPYLLFGSGVYAVDPGPRPIR